MDIPLPPTEHHPSRYHVFMQIAMTLAVITGVEIVIIFIPAFDWLQYTILVVLSTVKFAAVIFYFMHLRWDRLFCTILFTIGLMMGGGTMFALLALFAKDHTEAAADAAAEAAAQPAAAQAAP